MYKHRGTADLLSHCSKTHKFSDSNANTDEMLYAKKISTLWIKIFFITVYIAVAVLNQYLLRKSHIIIINNNDYEADTKNNPSVWTVFELFSNLHL